MLLRTFQPLSNVDVVLRNAKDGDNSKDTCTLLVSEHDSLHGVNESNVAMMTYGAASRNHQCE